MAASLGVTKQLAMIGGHLEQIQGVLGPLREINPELHDALQPMLDLEAAKLRGRIDAAGASPEPWTAFQEVRKDALALSTECLGFLGGAVALRARLDSGRCRIADHLVEGLRRDARLWGPAISVPAPGEYVNTMSSLIRVRFPGEGVWDLPVVVHEFGHSVCDQVGNGGAARSAVTAAASAGQPTPGLRRLARYEELWADVVATYVTGPAYAGTCLRVRFDPSRADPSSSGEADVFDSHPSVDKRAAAILGTLRHLEERRSRSGKLAGSFAATTNALGAAWERELAGAGTAGNSSAVGRAVQEAVAAYCKVLDDEVPTIRYPDLRLAEAARARLESGDQRPERAGVVDVLNAAWLVRIRAEDEGAVLPETVAARALAWCVEIAHG